MKAATNKVIGTRDEAEQKTPGGIVLMAAQEVIMNVVAVGPKAEGVSAGDRVVLGGVPKSEFKFEGKKYYTFEDYHVLAILEAANGAG